MSSPRCAHWRSRSAFDYNKPVLDDSGLPLPVAPAPSGANAVEPVAQSAAIQKFHSCRWRRAPEDGSTVDCCSHRDVLPLAGTTGFDAEAWCPDCSFYKLRRTPKKRALDEFRY